MNTPRIRTDLQATAAEEQGIKYFDVSDPKSGVRMRMYDFEWLIASRMDGARPFDEVAAWARERLGIQPSAGDLEDYAKKLRDLGFFELESDAPVRATATAATMLSMPAPAISTGNSSGNGASTKSPTEELDAIDVDAGEPELDEEKPMARLVAEAPLMGSPPREEEPSPPVIELPRVTRNNAPAATAPTMAMQSVTPPVQQPLRDEPPMMPLTDERAGGHGTGRMSVPQAPARSSAGSIIGIVVVLLLIGGGVYYVKFMGDAPAKVTTQLAAASEIVRLYDGSAPAKKSEGQTLTLSEAGKVADVVAVNSEVKAGTPLVTLDTYAKVEKDLADVKDREGYYEKQLAAAKAKNDDAAAKAAAAKVDEKKKLLTELEARVGKARLVATGTATVAQVLLKQGDDAKAGDPAVKLADKHVSAEFTLGPDAATLKPGQPMTLQGAAGGVPLIGHVAHVEGGKVTIEIADDAAAKVGDELRLVKQRISNVIPVPATAVVKREGADVVYVLADGAVHEHKVTVVDHNATQTLLSAGVTAGDQVVISGGEALHDGQKATP